MSNVEEKPELSVVIPVHNDEILLDHLLPTLQKELGTAHRTEIIVAADRCSEDFLKRLRQREKETDIKVFETRYVFGPSAARNLGAGKAKAAWLCFIDSDVEAQPGSFDAVWKFLEDPGDYKAANGNDTAEALDPSGGIARYLALSIWHTFTKHPRVDSTFVGTRHALVRKDVFQKVGEFSIAYPKADVEDYEFSIRLSKETRVKHLPDWLFKHRYLKDAKKQLSNYFRRARLYAPLMRKRPNDIGATSMASALAVPLSLLALLALVTFPFLFLVHTVCALGTLAAAAGCTILAILTHFTLMADLYKKEGLTNFVGLSLYFVLSMGVAGLGLIAGHLEMVLKTLVRGYRGLKRLWIFGMAYLKKNEPVYLIFFITGRCNARCPFCFNLDTVMAPPETDLDLETIEKTAKAFPNLIHLTLSGGEPFMRNDIVELVKTFYTHSKVRNLTIPTNGFFCDMALARVRDMALQMPDLTIRLSVSLDAVGDKHNELRRLNGGFEKAIRMLRQADVLSQTFPNIVGSVISVYSGHNEQEMRELIPYLDENVPSHMQSLLLARGDLDEKSAATDADTFMNLCEDMDRRRAARGHRATWFGKKLGDIAYKTRQTVYRVAKANFSTSEFFGCVAGKRMLVLWEDGRLSPCEIIQWLPMAKPYMKDHNDFYFGNITQTDNIRELFDNQNANNIRKFIEEKKCTCTYECAVSASIVFNPKAQKA